METGRTGKLYDVVIAGDVYCDLVFTGLPRMPQTGEELFSTDFSMVPGGVYTTAVTLQRLGLSVGLFTHVGDDFFSRFLLDSMQQEGLDLSLVQRAEHNVRSITVSLSFEHDRSFVSFADPRPVGASPVEAFARHRFRHMHIDWLGPLWREPGLISLAREQGATISLDCQSCPDMMARPDLTEKLRLVDVFMPNKAEALLIAGTDDPERAVRWLAQWTPTAIVKLGGEGSLAISGGELYRTAPMTVDAVDTTGAGDAFAGGYIYGMLSGMDVENSLQAATVCGGLSVTAKGGATNVPTKAQLDRLMQAGEEQS